MVLLRRLPPDAQPAGLLAVEPGPDCPLQQIRERGALSLIQAGKIAEAIAKVRNIWASLPGAGCGQPEQKLDRLLDVYRQAGGEVRK